MTLSNERLATSMAAGDEQALAECYQRYGSLIYTVALRALDDRGRAECVTAQTFVAAWRTRRGLPRYPSLIGRLIALLKTEIAAARTAVE